MTTDANAITAEVEDSSTSFGIALYAEFTQNSLLQVWRFAGPACCCKAVLLARWTGPFPRPARLLGVLQEPTVLPWREWWPDLASDSLQDLFRRPRACFLDRLWADLQAHPQHATMPTPDGRPVNVAVLGGHREATEILLRCGASLPWHSADSLLYSAAESCNSAALRILLFTASGAPRRLPLANVNARPVRHGGTALDVAVSVSQRRGEKTSSSRTRSDAEMRDCVKLLRNAGGRHSFHQAARLVLPDDIKAWLAQGADVDERDTGGATPLWLAVRGDSQSTNKQRPRSPSAADPESIQMIDKQIEWQAEEERRRTQSIAILLEARGDVNVLPISQATPLLVAAARGDAICCEQLLAARADPTVPDRGGRTPLAVARGLEVRDLLVVALARCKGENQREQDQGEKLCWEEREESLREEDVGEPACANIAAHTDLHGMPAAIGCRRSQDYKGGRRGPARLWDSRQDTGHLAARFPGNIRPPAGTMVTLSASSQQAFVRPVNQPNTQFPLSPTLMASNDTRGTWPSAQPGWVYGCGVTRWHS